MITPGVAGFLVMGISNSLWVAFEIPKSISAMIISTLIMALIISVFNAKFWEKAIFFILNTLLIFSVAFNSNHVAHTVLRHTPTEHSQFQQSATAPDTTRQATRNERLFFDPFFSN